MLSVGPQHPPLGQPRCSRGEDDASPADKNSTAGGDCSLNKDEDFVLDCHDRIDVQKYRGYSNSKVAVFFST